MKYYGIIKKTKLRIKIMIIILGVYIFYNGFVNNNYLNFLIAFIMILATFSTKKHVISEKGIDIIYVICGIKIHNIWNYEEINIIYVDSKKSNPNIELHFGKDLVYRKFIVNSKDVKNILNIISKLNSNIIVKEMSNSK